MFSSIVGSLTHPKDLYINIVLSAKPDIIVSGVVQTNLVNQHCSVGAALNLPSTFGLGRVSLNAKLPKRIDTKTIEVASDYDQYQLIKEGAL